MKNFVQYAPTEIVFGEDAENEVGRLAKNGAEAKYWLFTAAGA